MKKLMVIFLLLLAPSIVMAQQALTKDSMMNYFSAAKQLEALGKKYPELESTFEGMDFLNQKELTQKLKSLPIYDQIKKVITDSGYDGIEEFYGITMRFMSSMFAAQMEMMPAGVSLDVMTVPLQKQIEKMKQQGAPVEVIAELEDGLNKQMEQMAKMKKTAKKASPADIQFIKENMSWIMSQMPQDN